MHDCRLFIAGLVLLAAGWTGATDTAFAGTVAGRFGTAGQAGTVNTGLGSAAPQNLSVYGSGNNLQNATTNAVNLAVGTVAPMNASANNVNVQTNIDNAKTINASNNVNVTDMVNGSNVAYGGTGLSVYSFQSNALDVIDGVANFNAGVSANNGPNFTAVTDALESATFLETQPNGN